MSESLPQLIISNTVSGLVSGVVGYAMGVIFERRRHESNYVQDAQSSDEGLAENKIEGLPKRGGRSISQTAKSVGKGEAGNHISFSN